MTRQQRLAVLVANPVIFASAFLLLLCLVVGLIEPKFWTPLNIFDIFRNYAAWGIFAVGQTVIMICGGIDVSFTAIATVSMYIIGLLLINQIINSVTYALILAGGIGAILGLINGICIWACKVHPVIVTIATLNIYYNLLIYFTKGRWLYNLPKNYLDFGLSRVFTIIWSGQPTGLSILTLFWIGLAFCTWLWLRYTSFGRRLYAVGGNVEAARRSGLNILSTQLFGYMYAGLLAGIGGFIYGGAAQFIQPNALVGRELDVIAAAILGGASIFGGKGSALGSVLGTLLFAVVRNALILLKIPSYWHSAAVGGIILGATLLAAYQAQAFQRLGISRR